QRDGYPDLQGAQFTVAACTGVGNAQAQLLGGLSDGELAAIGEPVAVTVASTQDGCPAGKPYIARFPGVTLRESVEKAAGALVTPSRLTVQVTDESSSVGTSPPVDVWVDSAAPTLSAATPNPLCGAFRQTTGDWTTEVRLLSSVLPL